MPNTLLKKSSRVMKKKNTAYQEDLAYYDRSGHRRVPTIKQLEFAREYVKNKGNGKQAALVAYHSSSDKVAEVVASENLGKLVVRQEVMKLLQKNSIEVDDILAVHRRNMVQKKNLPTSQKAVTDFYDILGMKGQDSDRKQQVNVALVINK